MLEGAKVLNLENFVEDCRDAVSQDPTHRAVLQLTERAFSTPSDVVAAVGEPTESGLVPIYKSPDLTIVNVIWKPGMTLMPHNHEMWAVIGIYGGREDNIFWRRIKDDPNGHIEAAGAKALSTGDVIPLGKDIIHSVTNPIQRLTGAIHIYGGDFFEAERSEWDAENLTEHPYDMSKVKALFSD
jgi:predicted metal-dependent enzyme (double-stranded beta helix superfamily)